jgi:transcriptional regulator with XRE-family HTH domain
MAMVGKRLSDWWLAAVGMVIVGARREAGVTQEQLADKLNWPLSKLVLIECWESEVTVKELAYIARALDTPPEQLFGRIVQWVGCYEAWRFGGRRFSEIGAQVAERKAP